MMRIFLALCLISLALACAHKDAGKGLAKFSGRANPEGQTDQNLQQESSDDSTFYIGYVDYFPETQEFYTALHHREGHEYPDEDLLEAKLDSAIAWDDDWGRERLPMEEAKKMLMLTGLDTLAVFNRKHEQICRCPLTRVEYLWNGLESYFIAVFATDGKFPGQTEELYGISANLPLKERVLFSSEEFNDTPYNEYVRKQLSLNGAIPWDMRHYRITPPGMTFSIVSAYSLDNNQGRSYITYNNGQQVQVLNEEINNFQFLNILPVPINVNGRPLLLISAGYPSSDVVWDYLAGYDGTRYEAFDYNRIHMKQMAPAWSRALSQTAHRIQDEIHP